MSNMDDVMERLRNALKDTGMTDDQIDALSDDEDDSGDEYFYRAHDLPSQPTLH